MDNKNLIKAITFSPFSRRGTLLGDAPRESLKRMVERTGANYIILAPSAIQQTPQSEHIDFTSERTYSEEEIGEFIDFAHSIGIGVIVKPTVNCANGTWRAHINFFDEDVVCEPKWSNWFKSYTDYQMFFAKIAEAHKAEIFIPGCEMVQTERRETEWRKLISDLRTVFSGPISYNTDKYQEHNVKWWDCVDYISSSGYYPINDWENQLDRIEKVVKKFNKPFFFAECGCMSTEGSPNVPNDWGLEGGLDMQGQADWYEAMFSACAKREWVGGFGIWSWDVYPYDSDKAHLDAHYDIYAKPAEKVVAKYYGA